jgi:hypothetical protein
LAGPLARAADSQTRQTQLAVNAPRDMVHLPCHRRIIHSSNGSIPPMELSQKLFLLAIIVEFVGH